MAHHDNRSGEVAYRFLKNILRGYVKMVCGFVENQEIDRFEKQTDHGEACLLSSRQHFHFLVHCLAAEHEGPEDVADPGAHIARGHVVDCLEYGDFSIQHLCLILREVTYPDIMTDLQCACIGNLSHDTFHQS